MSWTEPDPAEPGHPELQAAEPGAGYATGQQDEFVPGLAPPGPGLEYLVSQQRRRSRRFTAVAGAVIAIVIIAALIAVVLPSGHHGRSGVQLTAAQVVAKAVRREAGLQTYTASVSEQFSGSASVSIAGTVKFRRSPLAFDTKLTVTADGHTVPISAIMNASAMYMKLPSSAGLPPGMASKWLRLPLIGPGGTSPLAALEQEVQRDNPLSQTAMLAAAEHLRRAGSAVIAGVSTTKYTGWVRAAQAVKSLPAAERSSLAPYLRLVSGKIPIAVWVDGHDDVRKAEATEHIGASRVRVSITILTFNQPVSITIPPASQVYAVPRSDMTD